MKREMIFKPKIFATIGLVLTAAILLSVMILKSTQKNKISILPTPTTPTPKEKGIIIPDQNKDSKQKMISLATEDLVKNENINKKDIKVKRVEERKWSDTSLGCRKPGTFYAQVITEGFLIILEANGTEYNYHTDLERVVQCN